MNEPRYSTAIHEAGHAVVSYLLGRRIMHVALFTDTWGEVLTEIDLCDSDGDYYERHSPQEDPHSKRIQDDLRRDMAIAVAGEVAQRIFCGDCTIDDSELKRDRALAERRAAHIHRGLSPPYCFIPWKQCSYCEAYLKSMRQRIKQMISQPRVVNSIEALAQNLAKLENGIPRPGSEVEDFFRISGLGAGSQVSSLPTIPTPSRNEPSFWGYFDQSSDESHCS